MTASFKAPIFHGTDAVTLLVCVPVLLIALAWYRRGSLRGGLFLTSMLAYFLYNSISLAVGAAYNNILLLYMASFSLSFFALILAFLSLDLGTVEARTSPRLPQRLDRGVRFYRRSLAPGLADGYHRCARLPRRATHTRAVLHRSNLCPGPGHHHPDGLPGWNPGIAPQPVGNVVGFHPDHGQRDDWPGRCIPVHHAGDGWDLSYTRSICCVCGAVRDPKPLLQPG